MRRALGVYCYAGGFSLGVKRHFMVDTHLEDAKPYAAGTCRDNLSDVDILSEMGDERHNWWTDVETAKYSSILRTARLGRPGAWRDDYCLIYGNPPCAAWSQAGRRGDAWRTDPRVHCTTRHLSLIDYHQPKVWVWETIRSTWLRGREFVDDVAANLAARGYHTTVWLHNVKWYGGIQDRARVFVVGSRHAPFRPMYRPNQEQRETAWHAAAAIDRLNDIGAPYDGPEQRHSYLWKDTPDGRKLVDTFDRLYLPSELIDSQTGKKMVGISNVKDRPGFQLRRLPSQGPSPTIVVPMMHHQQERWLSEREMSLICGYPGDWRWSRGRGFGAAIINEMSRGVSPLMGDWLGRLVYNHLEGASSTAPPTYRVVDVLNKTTVETILC